MKRFSMLLLVCLLVAGSIGTTVESAAGETKLLRNPDVSKDRIVFVYAGDLWTAAKSGGNATRLTVHAGDELYPKFSPDGQWIAFTGEYDGNADVYVIPAEGGEPRRLTYHPGQDFVLGWSPDGKKILFRSARHAVPPSGIFLTQLFTVSPEGGMAEQLSVSRASLASYSPDGTKVAFNPTSQEFRTWKRYRGGWYNYIGIYDLKTNAYEELPRNKTLDQFPMWHGNAIYFISDRDGVMNLFKYELGNKRTSKLTNFTEFDIKWPSLGAGTDEIAFENGGVIHLFNVRSGKDTPVRISVNTDALTARPALRNVAPWITTHNLSPTGTRALFQARGDIFTTPAEHGSSRNLTNSPGVHELNPVWSPDGKWIAYLSDRSGEYELYTMPQRGGEETRITSDGKVYRYGPLWSPDSKKLLFWDKDFKLWYVDINEKKSIEVDRDDYNTINDATWSPDSRWIAYSKSAANRNGDIVLYSLEQKKAFPVTDVFYNDVNPVWDWNGKYLYFISNRYFHPAGDTYDFKFNYYHTAGIYAVTLQKDEPSPFAPRSDEEKDADEKPAGAAPPAGGAAPPAAAPAGAPPAGGAQRPPEKKEEKPIQIDIEGITNRVVTVPGIPPGTYGQLTAGRDKFFYTSTPFEVQQAGVPQQGPPQPPNTLMVYDMKSRDAKPILTGIGDYAMDKEGKKVLYHAGPQFGIVDATAAPPKRVGDGRLNVGEIQAVVDSREEWKQMFREGWRIQRDFFWDPEMGGRDWAALGKRYEALLPYVAHRSDLSYILGELVAELETSHAYVQGGDVPQRPQVNVGMLGVDFAQEGGFYKFARIYKGENWNPQTRAPLAEPGLKVKQGDFLIAVNGRPVNAKQDPYAAFQNLSGRVVTLRVNSKPSTEGAWDITVTPVASEVGVRYADWIEDRREYVAKRTNGRVGYMHVPNTAVPGLINFDRYFAGQIDKDGLIIDERYNGGGFIPSFFTDKLKRQYLASVAPRTGKDTAWPPSAIFGPKVMVVNELAGSGGDAFPWFFQKEKIGPVVGERTWGGLVGIGNGIPMIDGGAVTPPGFGFHADGKWIAENYGVDPDYPVNQRPDLEFKGQDPQLDKAIELANEGLKTYKAPGARPKYPRSAYTPKK